MKKVVLITGTTSGLGYELSKVFSRTGYDLVLVSRNEQKLKSQKEELQKNHDISIHIIAKELSDPAAAEAIYEEVKARNIHVDILINNAGFNESGPFYETSIEKELEMLHVHVMTLTRLTKIFLPGMMKNGFGKILNIGSTGSFVPCPLDAVYCASKAYVLSFTDAINSELSGTGVTASVLCPGAMKTEFAKKAGMEKAMLFRRFVMDPREVAQIAFRQFMKNKRVIIPGSYNKLLVASIPFTPGKILEKVSIFLLDKRL